MLPDTVFVATPIDTAAATAFVAQTLTGLFASWLPWISPTVAGPLVGVLSGGAVTGLVYLWRHAVNAVQHRKGLAWITPLWARYRGVATPLLALGLGELTSGTWLTGAVGIVIHQLIKGSREAREAPDRETVRHARAGA